MVLNAGFILSLISYRNSLLFLRIRKCGDYLAPLGVKLLSNHNLRRSDKLFSDFLESLITPGDKNPVKDERNIKQ